MNAQEALERLLTGNRRYAATRQIHPRQTVVHRQMLVDGQNPFAAILSCSDSRVPSELIFDQGLGDLFIVRTAGHAVNELVLASLEYAVFALKVPLIMVLGHGSCGAVLSVIASAAEGRVMPGHLPYLVSCIQPTLEDVDLSAEDVVERSIRANSRRTREYLAANSPLLAQAVHDQQLRVVAAYYDLGSGRVELLEPL